MKKGPINSLEMLTDESVFSRYILKRKIGHGGMAEVFLGRQLEADSDTPPQVIKCILPELSGNPQFLAMFINEAQLAAQMEHPNIVQVLDFGEFNGRLYMAMEYVEGLDCWRFTRRLHPWGDDHAALAVWIICRVLDALEYAHEMTDVNGRPLNVVHRDLSPSNIYLSLSGEVKLGDFGIAKIDSDRYRQIKMIPKGKFGYVAPEQVEGLSIDKRADIFAVGVVLAELLIGKKMFSGQSQLSIMLEIKEGQLETLEQNVDRIEPRLLEIMHGALTRRPEDRYGSAAEFREALSTYIEGQGRTSSTDELAIQVRRAVELRDKMSSMPAGYQRGTPITPEVTPLDAAATTMSVFNTPGPWPNQEQDLTPVAAEYLIEADENTPFAGTPITWKHTPFEDEWQYTARLPDDSTIGPTSFAHIIELICSDEISQDTMISVDGHNYVPAYSRPELMRHLPVYTPTRDVDELNTPDRRGVLQLEAPGEVILSLAIHGETGMLVCKQGRKRKEVYFQEGHPVYVSSNDPGELLGEYLVSEGAIERSELELALALLPKFNGHMGDTLIALGMLSAVKLFNYIGDQIRNRFKELVAWQHGHYDFYRGVSCRPDIFEVTVEPFALVSEYLLKNSKRIPVESTFTAMADSTIVPSSLIKGLLPRLPLPQKIGDILRDLLEPSTLTDLITSQKDPNSKQILVQSLYLAVETGLWIVEGSSPPWRAMEII
ncbi:MAG: serine/threonine protein kinase [Proteobacteria bacterium]|nr:serine/threonine protein kinase [Pseudomonadota bacterium]